MPMQILLRSYLNKMVHLSCMVFLRLRKVPVADCQAALFDLQQQSDHRQRRASAQLYLQEMTQSTFLHFGHGGGELVAAVLALALRHDDALPGLVDAVHIDAIEVRLEPNLFPVFAILPHDRGRRERGGREGAVERGRRKGSSRDGSSRGCRREGSSRGVIERGSSRAVVESRPREWSSSGHRWPQQRCGLQDEHTVGVLDIVKLSREHFWLENLIQLLSHRQALTECGSSFLAAQIETGDLKLVTGIYR